MLRDSVGVEVAGVIILVDRCERGSRECTAVQEAESDLGIKVHPIVTIHEIVEYLRAPNSSGIQLSSEMLDKIAAYRAQYGA